MQQRCATCGKEGGTIRSFTQVEASTNERLTMCDECLEQRATKHWNANDPQGKELLNKIPGKDRYKDQRYAYLVEPEETIHLVRLRKDWLAHHTEEP